MRILISSNYTPRLFSEIFSSAGRTSGVRVSVSASLASGIRPSASVARSEILSRRCGGFWRPESSASWATARSEHRSSNAPRSDPLPELRPPDEGAPVRRPPGRRGYRRWTGGIGSGPSRGVDRIQRFAVRRERSGRKVKLFESTFSPFISFFFLLIMDPLLLIRSNCTRPRHS
jgi:hypothetical protein